MAVLPEADRDKLARGLMRYWSQSRELTAFEKAGVRQIVDDLDVFIDTNAVTINLAISQPYRNQATTGQKAFIFAAVALARYDVPTVRRLLQID